MAVLEHSGTASEGVKGCDYDCAWAQWYCNGKDEGV